MKKLLTCFVIISVLLSACKKDVQHVFDKSPDERLNEALAAYQTQLSGAQYGWKAVLNPAGGGTYAFYFKFNDSNRVKMLSDFDSLSAVTLKESSYRLKALQQPSLIFDTYSYLHVLSDPDASVNGGNFGSGLLSDFEFYFDSTTTDTIKLVGRFNGSKLLLVRANQAEAAAYNNGELAAGLYINKILTYFKRITIGSQLIDININPGTHKITFSWLDANGNPQTFSTTYSLTLGGIIFANPLVIGSLVINSFDNVVWDPATETISFTSNNTAATITGIVTPLKVDLTAPQRWYQYALTNDSTYWISPTGFHVNGVDDAYGITTLASGGNTYYYLIYWPLYGTSNDLFAPIYLNAAQTGLTLLYGAAPRIPTFTADGRAIFKPLGSYGTYPATGPAALSRAKLYDPAGYYFVQIDASTYDMVSASDGKSWITWFL